MFLTHALITQGVAGNSVAQPSQAVATLPSPTVEVISSDRQEIPAVF